MELSSPGKINKTFLNFLAPKKQKNLIKRFDNFTKTFVYSS